MQALIAFLRDHWRAMLPALAVGGVAGWLAHRPAQPAVHAVQDDHAVAATAATADTSAHEGPKRKLAINFDPAPGAPASIVRVPGVAAPVQVPAGERVEGVTIEDDAASDTETHTASATRNTADHHLDLTITPQPQPGWAVGVGIDGLSARTLRLSARRRLLGPFWAEISAVPATRSVGVGLAVEW